MVGLRGGEARGGVEDRGARLELPCAAASASGQAVGGRQLMGRLLGLQSADEVRYALEAMFQAPALHGADDALGGGAAP